MNKKRFMATCLLPTLTTTVGKSYEVITEDKHQIIVLNDKGFKTKFMRFRFGPLSQEDIPMEEVPTNKATCINSAKYRSITKSKVYDITKESKDFYYIINNLGKEARYSKKFFTRVVEKKEVPKSLKAVCVYTIKNELSFKQAYDFVEKPHNMVEVTNDKGVKSQYVKKRFEYEMV